MKRFLLIALVVALIPFLPSDLCVAEGPGVPPDPRQGSAVDVKPGVPPNLENLPKPELFTEEQLAQMAKEKEATLRFDSSESLKAEALLTSELAKRAELRDPERDPFLRSLDESTPRDSSSLGSGGSGTNNLDFGVAWYGDVVLGRNGWSPVGYWGHNASYDPDFGWRPICESTPSGGVHYSTRERWWYGYDKAALYRVRTYDWVRYYSTWYTYYQYGKPYDWWFNKWDQSRFYCSELAWASYYWWFGIDLEYGDPNFVTPDNLAQTGWTYCIAWSD